VRERVVVRKRTETHHQRVEAELRKERVEIDAGEGVEPAEGSADSPS
jgi:stress response protein YsnF